MYTHKKMKTTAETSLAVLKEVLPLLKAQEDYSNDALYAMLSAYVAEKGYKNGYVMWPIRTATSGKQMTPCGATEIMEVIGKEESIARIEKAIDKLKRVFMSSFTKSQSRSDPSCRRTAARSYRPGSGKTTVVTKECSTWYRTAVFPLQFWSSPLRRQLLRR